MQRFLITFTQLQKNKNYPSVKTKMRKVLPSKNTFNEKKLAQSDLVIRTEDNTVQGEFAAINVVPCKGIRILESRKFLIVESGILGFGISNTAQGIRNSTLIRLESGVQVQLIKNHGTETSTWNPESTGWIIDCLGFLYMGRINGMNFWWSQIHSKLWPYMLLSAVHPD